MPTKKNGSAYERRMIAQRPFIVRKKLPEPAQTGTSMPTLNTMASVWNHHGSGENS